MLPAFSPSAYEGVRPSPGHIWHGVAACGPLSLGYGIYHPSGEARRYGLHSFNGGARHWWPALPLLHYCPYSRLYQTLRNKEVRLHLRFSFPLNSVLLVPSGRRSHPTPDIPPGRPQVSHLASPTVQRPPELSPHTPDIPPGRPQASHLASLDGSASP